MRGRGQGPLGRLGGVQRDCLSPRCVLHDTPCNDGVVGWGGTPDAPVGALPALSFTRNVCLAFLPSPMPGLATRGAGTAARGPFPLVSLTISAALPTRRSRRWRRRACPSTATASSEGRPWDPHATLPAVAGGLPAMQASSQPAQHAFNHPFRSQGVPPAPRPLHLCGPGLRGLRLKRLPLLDRQRLLEQQPGHGATPALLPALRCTQGTCCCAVLGQAAQACRPACCSEV